MDWPPVRSGSRYPTQTLRARHRGELQRKALDTLKFAGKDAQDFADVLLVQKGKLYRDVEVQVIPGKKATRAAVLTGLQSIKRETTSNDVAMIFLSGHGTDDEDGTYYFLPADADPGSLLVTAVPWLQIKGTVTTLTGKVLFFVDTCRAGNLTGGARKEGKAGCSRHDRTSPQRPEQLGELHGDEARGIRAGTGGVEKWRLHQSV